LAEGTGALVGRARAVAALAAGDRVRAIELIDAGAAEAERLGVLPELARCRLTQARLAGDPARSRDLHAEARARFADLGMAAYVTRADASAP
jgi:hypothetical protein